MLKILYTPKSKNDFSTKKRCISESFALTNIHLFLLYQKTNLDLQVILTIFDIQQDLDYIYITKSSKISKKILKTH